MALRKDIPPETEQAIASFDFTDLASGTGVEIFFGTASDSFNSTLDYHLVSTGDAKAGRATTQRASAGTTVVEFETTEFNLQRTARGTAFLSASMGLNNTKGHITGEISIIHADGGETIIADKVSGQSVTIGATDTSEMMFIPLPLTETIIKEGEKLRLSVDIFQASSGNMELGHDPTGEAGSIIPLSTTTHTTKMQLLMPFRVDE